MAGVHGERFYGYVDHVPGLAYIATRFFHLNFVPLIPLGSFVIVDGTESEKGFQGQRIGWNAKSIFAGCFRGWVGTVALVVLMFTAMKIAAILAPRANGDGEIILTIVLMASVFGATLWTICVSNRSWMLAYGLLIVSSVAYIAWESTNPPPPAPPNPFKAANNRGIDKRAEVTASLAMGHACLFAVTLLRTFDRGSRGRAYELGAMLGLDEDAVERVIGVPHDLDSPSERDEIRP
jgi:hypothetical protein